MTYFKLDIPKVDESVSSYKEKKKNYMEEIGYIYNGLVNTDSAWNDVSSNAFIKQTKQDKAKVVNYFSYLDKLYSEIAKFKSNIDSICSKQGYKKNSVTLKYDDSDLETCKRYFNDVVYILNSSLDDIKISYFGYDFKYLDLVYSLREEIISVRDSVNEIIEAINTISREIKNEIYDSKERLKKIDYVNINIKPFEYKNSLVYLDTKKITSQKSKIVDVDKVTALKKKNIVKSSSEANLNSNVSSQINGKVEFSNDLYNENEYLFNKTIVQTASENQPEKLENDMYNGEVFYQTILKNENKDVSNDVNSKTSINDYFYASNDINATKNSEELEKIEGTLNAANVVDYKKELNIELDSKNEINNSTIISNEIKGTNNVENIDHEINYVFNKSVESNAMNNVNNNVKSINANLNEVSNVQKENTASTVSNNIASTNMNTGEVIGVQKESTASTVSNNMTSTNMNAGEVIGVQKENTASAVSNNIASTNMNTGEVIGVQKENTASAVSSNIDSINKNNGDFIQPNSINDLF